MEKLIKKNNNKGLIITVGNYKGGAGKTSNSTLIGYTLAKQGIKVLVVDLDPQTNATKALLLTKSALEKDNIMTINKTIMSGVANGSLADLPVNIMPNYDLLPSYPDFGDFPKYVYKHANNETEEVSILKPLLDELRPNYDLIILDIPPMSREVTANASVASDYTLISFQTQERSL
ncbi:MAG: AAA family ATPase, partial [Lactococcus lactis]|nr:AAA family ATPase [Lactococcus lactis]